MSELPTPTFSAISPWPSRSLAEPNYDVLADLANDSYEIFHDELAVAIPWFEDARDGAETAATTASTAATNATAAQTAAENAASATAWVSGGSYTLGDVHWSLIDFLPYRAKTTHSGLTTDPSEDATNWAVVGGIPVHGGVFTGGVSENHTTVTSTSNALAIDCDLGNDFTHVLTENTTVSFTDPPASGASFGFSLEIVQDASASGYTVTWPASVRWPSATAPTLTADANAIDVFVFKTDDAGTTWYGFVAGQAMGVPA